MDTRNHSAKQSKSNKSTSKKSAIANAVAPISSDVTRSVSHASQLQQQKDESPRIRLIPIHVVQEILGVGRTFVIEHSANNDLPRPVRFGTSRRAAVRWFEHEIFAYVNALAAQRDQQAFNSQAISPAGAPDCPEGQDM